MKTLLLSFVLAAGTCFAQNAAAPAKAAPSSPGTNPELSAPATNQGVCYTLRVYHFTRDDGTDRLAGERSCTPAQRFHATYIPVQPKMQFVPAIQKQRKEEPPSR